MPAWPPITVTSRAVGSIPWLAATKVLARQTSNVVTPQTWRKEREREERIFRRQLGGVGVIPARLARMRDTYLRVIHALLLEHPGCDRDGRVDRVGDDAEDGVLADTLDERSTMPAFVLKRSSRVMPGLRGTRGMTTTSAPCRLEAGVAAWRPGAGGRQVAGQLRLGRAVRQVGRDAGQHRSHIVARNLIYVWRELAEQRERLADAAGSAEHGNLHAARLRRHERAAHAGGLVSSIAEHWCRARGRG